MLHLKRFIVVERPVSPVAQGDENQTPNSPAKPVQVEYIFKKNKAPVFIPPSLSLKAFVATQLTDKEASASSNALTMTSESYSEFHNDYLLKSIVHHIGSRASSGHYTADAVRHGEGAESQDKDATSETAKSTEDEWVSFDDGNVVRTTLKTITEGRFKQETAYMLLYTLNDDDTNSAEKFSSSLEKGNH